MAQSPAPLATMTTPGAGPAHAPPPVCGRDARPVQVIRSEFLVSFSERINLHFSYDSRLFNAAI